MIFLTEPVCYLSKLHILPHLIKHHADLFHLDRDPTGSLSECPGRQQITQPDALRAVTAVLLELPRIREAAAALLA